MTCGGVHRHLGESVSVSPFIKLVAANEYTGDPCSQGKRVDCCDAAPVPSKPVARIMDLHSWGQDEIPQGSY